MTDLRSQLQSTLGSAYAIERELGGGGMSHVFVAEEQALARKVVVKVLPPQLMAGVNVDRFKREIQLSAKLQHPHIVPVLTTGEMNGVPYYTMPFVEGESLRARLVRTGALSITDAISVLRDLARALAYAHEHGVVHRDIKPDNILLSGGSATVADFGIAKAISAARGEHEAATLTQIGTSLGTPAYMAPEQAAADPATDHRADIYAFGCVAYELLAGRPPFTAKTPQRLLAAHMGEKPLPVAQLRADTPQTLADLVMHCLEKEADARPQNAADLVRVLETVTSGGTHGAVPGILLGGPGTFRKALLYYAAAFVIVAIVTRAAIIAIGLPDWVLPGAVLVMLMGLPVILFTGYVQRVVHRAITMTPTYTPGGTQSVAAGTMATIAMKASPHVSWRRAARGGAYALAAFTFVVAAFMALRALGIGPAGSLFAAGKLNENDRLIVADFGVNGSADSSLGSVVAEAIRTDLGQSRVVSIVPTSAIRAALQRMQRPADTRLGLVVARDLAQREGIKAVVHGDITPLGAGFIVSARLLTASTGDELASFRETAAGAADLVPAVEKLSRALRARIGESLRAVRATPPLEQVTTASLEALRKYTEGNAVSDVNTARAIELLRDAVTIDSTFAMAWRKLAVMYSNGGYPRALQDTAITRAFAHRDRLTQTERDNVEGFYYGTVRQDRAREVEAYERVVARGELGAAAHNLALRYLQRREYVRAESLYRRVVSSRPAALVSYQNLAWVLYNRGQLAGMDSVLDLADHDFNKPSLLLRLRVTRAYDGGRLDSAMKITIAMRNSPDLFSRRAGWNLGANLEAVRGRLKAARPLRAQARIVDSTRGAEVFPLADSISVLMEDAWFRERPEQSARRLDELARHIDWRTLTLDQRPYFDLASGYAQAGRPDRARAVLALYDRDVRDSTRRRIDRPTRDAADAEIALAERRYADAFALFRKADSLPDGPAGPCVPCLDISLARTFDHAGQADSAAAYFEKYITVPYAFRLWGAYGAPPDVHYRAFAHRRLGELYEARGDAGRAVQQYQSFVDLWKDADPDLQPKVQEVRRRIARLRDSESTRR